MNVRTEVATLETLDEDVTVSTIYNSIVEVAFTGYDTWAQMDVTTARALAQAILDATDRISTAL